MSLALVLLEVSNPQEHELAALDAYLREHRRRFSKGRRITGRFDGPFTINQHGVIQMAQFTIIAGKKFDGKLVFADSTGATVPGPLGTLTANPSDGVTAALTSDGQGYTLTVAQPASITPVTLEWTDPAGVQPSFSASFLVNAAPVILTGSFEAPTEDTSSAS